MKNNKLHQKSIYELLHIIEQTTSLVDEKISIAAKSLNISTQELLTILSIVPVHEEHSDIEEMSIFELLQIIEQAKSIVDEKINVAAESLNISSKKLSSLLLTRTPHNKNTREDDQQTPIPNDAEPNGSDYDQTQTHKIMTDVPVDRQVKEEDKHKEVFQNPLKKGPKKDNDDTSDIEFPILTRLANKARKSRPKNITNPNNPLILILKPVRRNAWNFTWTPRKEIIRAGNNYILKGKETQWGRITSTKGIIPTIMKGGSQQILITRKH